ATTLNGGTLSVLGNAAAATTETIGAITLGGGASTISLSKGNGGTLALAGTTLNRAAGSGGTLDGSDARTRTLGNTTLLTFSTAPGLTGTSQPGGSGLLPYATVNGSELATYNGSNGLRTYKGTINGTGGGGNYQQSIAALTAVTDNLQLSANDSV